MVNFDHSPLVYLIVVHSIGGILLAFTIRPIKWMHNQTWTAIVKSDAFFLSVTLATLFLLRLPSIVYNQEINVDESQQITQALTLRQHPVYFQSVDGTTGGPLNSYLLILPSFFGLPFDYITARLVAFGLIAISLLLLFYTARSALDQQSTRMSLIPFVFLLGSSETRDFIIYSSELLSVATLSWLYYLFITDYKKSARTYPQLILIGFLCGIVPFEKIQATFLAGAIGLFVLIQILNDKQVSVTEKWRSFFALTGGVVCFPMLFIGWMYKEGLFKDFVNFYILDNLSYSIFITDNSSFNQPVTLLQKLLGFRAFLTSSAEFGWLIYLFLGVFLVWLFTVARRQMARKKLLMIYILLILLISVYSVIHSGTFFAHYLFYLFGPLMLLLGLFFNTIRTYFSRLSTILLIAVFISAFSIRIVNKYVNHYSLNSCSSENQKGWSVPQDIVTKTIAKYGNRGESLAVWGWRIDYYVRLQMPQAVAENHTIRSIKHKTMKAMYNRRYVANMIHSLPPVFVDAVGKQDFYFKDRKTQGYETNKALRKIIDTHYTYAGMADDVRIFVRNDRYDHVTCSKASANKLTDQNPI